MSQKFPIVVVDYGLGNLGSIINMLKRIGANAVISANREVIAQAEKLILPGVGAFDMGMQNLEEKGLLPVLNEKVLQDKTPVLGLCLGMQLLGRASGEGQLAGLGWLQARTVRFQPGLLPAQAKIPHMGWNTVQICRPHSLFRGLEGEARFYFVHSYHVICDEEDDLLARTDYGYSFASAVAHENVMGVQFHPEKSHRFGMQLLRNFAEVV